MVKPAKTKAGGEVFLIKRGADGQIVGDYVVAKGISLFCKIGQINEGKKVSARYFSEKEFEANIKSKHVVTSAEYYK